jgi:hypothetical protein
VGLWTPSSNQLDSVELSEDSRLLCQAVGPYGIALRSYWRRVVGCMIALRTSIIQNHTSRDFETFDAQGDRHMRPPSEHAVAAMLVASSKCRQHRDKVYCAFRRATVALLPWRLANREGKCCICIKKCLSNYYKAILQPIAQAFQQTSYALWSCGSGVIVVTLPSRRLTRQLCTTHLSRPNGIKYQAGYCITLCICFIMVQ